MTTTTTTSTANLQENGNRYPGFGLSLRYNPEIYGRFYPIGAHGGCEGGWSMPLLVREVAMMNLMEQLTEKADWHIKVFNNGIVDKWREEALAIPDAVFWEQAAPDERADERKDECPLRDIMTTEVFDYCMSELRNKARNFQQTGIVPTLDASAAIAKSDTLADTALRRDFCMVFEQLIESQGAAPDWHPGSNDMVQDLVHPSMYPLVYGESRILREEVVGTVDAIEKWAGKGEIIGLPADSGIELPRPNTPDWDEPPFIPESFWSGKYQWLPANVKFDQDGSVKFTSYINNLHPVRHANIYKTIESLLGKAIPLWDQCLATVPGSESGVSLKAGAGRYQTRFKNLPDPNDGNPDNWVPSTYDGDEYGEGWEEWVKIRRPVQPQPDPFVEIDYAPQPANRLSQKFKDTGLQIIVKMASIELTPEKPEFSGGSWHIEGQMNEKICATALFYVDEENIEPSSLAFRMQTSLEVVNNVLSVEQSQDRWIGEVFGTDFSANGDACLQTYGSVKTPQGRLLAFPNVFQHRVSPFRLKDPTKPGHRRFIALWLIDPFTRIISTANVPPQQQDWWEPVLLSHQPGAENLPFPPAEVVQLLQEQGLLPDGVRADGTVPKLSAELLKMVRKEFEPPVMSRERAFEHREKLMAERTQYHQGAEAEWSWRQYNFCEH